MRLRCIEVLAHHAEDLLRAGQAQEASAVAARALSLDPGSEHAVRIIMRSLVLAGDRAGALERYEEFTQRLHQEIGTQPDPETQALADRVRHERTIRPPAPGRSGEPAEGEPRLPSGRAGTRAVAPRRCCRRRSGGATCVRPDPRRGKRSGEDPADGGAARETPTGWCRCSRGACGRRRSRRGVERHSRARPGRSARGPGVGGGTRPGSGRIPDALRSGPTDSPTSPATASRFPGGGR